MWAGEFERSRLEIRELCEAMRLRAQQNFTAADELRECAERGRACIERGRAMLSGEGKTGTATQTTAIF